MFKVVRITSKRCRSIWVIHSSKRRFCSSKPSNKNSFYDDKGIAAPYKEMYAGQDKSPLTWIIKALEDRVVSAANTKFKNNGEKLKIMDVACGEGSYLRRIHSLDITQQILGIDISKEQIDAAKSYSVDIDYMTLDAKELITYTDLHNKFDIINASWLYNEGAKNKDELLFLMKGIYKCLKLGGIHTGITINPDVMSDSQQSLEKYGIQPFYPNKEVGYKGSVDGEPTNVKLMVNNEISIEIENSWYSFETYYNSFKEIQFEDVKLIHALEWDINDDVNTMNEKEKTLFIDYANYNPQPILFTMSKN